MTQSFETTRRVEFRDTDMAGIVHFSVFFTYMEEVEHEFLRSLGLGVVSRISDPDLGCREYSWPRVSATCDYRRAIKFEQIIRIQLRIERIGQKSITYRFHFGYEDEIVAEGRITAVCCLFEHGARPQSVEIPSAFREKLIPFASSA